MYKLTIERTSSLQSQLPPPQPPEHSESLDFRTLEAAKRYITQNPLNNKFEYIVTLNNKKINLAQVNNGTTLHLHPLIQLPLAQLIEILDEEKVTRLPRDQGTPATV